MTHALMPTVERVDDVEPCDRCGLVTNKLYQPRGYHLHLCWPCLLDFGKQLLAVMTETTYDRFHHEGSGGH